MIFDAAGRCVMSRAIGAFEGLQKVTFDGAKLSSGVYFVRLKAGGETASLKLLLLK